jgi:L-lactate utilization protein LutC
LLLASLVADSEWSIEAAREDLIAEFEKRLKAEKVAQLRKLHEFISNKLKAQLAEPIQRALEKSEPNMWQQIREHTERSSATLRKLLESRLQGFQCSSAEIQEKLQEFDAQLFGVAREAVSDKAYERVQALLQKRFQYIFANNRSTLPRQWKETDNVQSEHQAALDEVCVLVCLCTCVLVCLWRTSTDLLELQHKLSTQTTSARA